MPNEAQWSPDGQQIAFVGATASGPTPRIYTVPAAGGTPRRATTRDLPEVDPCWSADGRHLLFGSLREAGPSTSPNAVIQVLDVPTGKVSELPGSQGLFAPRCSPDGRHVAALSLDSRRLLLFDVGLGKWTELYKGALEYPTWSRDGRHVYFDANTEVSRVRIADGHVEVVAKVTGFIRGAWNWVGLAPDDSPLVGRDAVQFHTKRRDFSKHRCGRFAFGFQNPDLLGKAIASRLQVLGVRLQMFALRLQRFKCRRVEGDAAGREAFGDHGKLGTE